MDAIKARFFTQRIKKFDTFDLFRTSVVHFYLVDRKFPDGKEGSGRSSGDGLEGKICCKLPVGLGGNIAKLDPLAS